MPDDSTFRAMQAFDENSYNIDMVCGVWWCVVLCIEVWWCWWLMVFKVKVTVKVKVKVKVKVIRMV